MAKTTTKPTTKRPTTARSPLDDLAGACVDVNHLATRAALARLALSGLLTTARDLNVPPADLGAFAEPINEALLTLSTDLTDATRRLVDVGKRLAVRTKGGRS